MQWVNFNDVTCAGESEGDCLQVQVNTTHVKCMTRYAPSTNERLRNASLNL